MRIRSFSFAMVSALSISAVARAQAPVPDPHWGAFAFPSSVPELRAGLHFNRFTEFSSTGSRFNDIDETSGFNVLAASYTDRIPGLPQWTFTGTFGLGLSSDDPTNTIQNDFVHEAIGQEDVPVGDVREEPEFLAGLGVTRWFEDPEHLGRDLFVGAGYATSTLYHEPWLHLGGTYMLGGSCRLSLMHRVSRPVEGEAYSDLARLSNLSQVYVAYVPSTIDSEWSLLDLLGNPEIGLAVTHDTGLFVDQDDDPIETWFASLRFRWATGLTIETWNDFANGTDFGPTFGFLMSVDLTTLPGSPLFR